MEDLLISLLESFGYSVMKQGSLADNDAYPESFFTFWNNTSNESTFYDNVNYSEIGDFDVNFYSTDPVLVYSKIRESKTLLKANNFIVYESGHDVASDVDTHTGRGISVLYNDF